MDILLASQPETAPWLGVLSAVLEEAAETPRLGCRRRLHHPPGRARARHPLLAGARIPIDARLADRWVRRVLALAAEAGPEAIGLRAAAG